MYLLAHMWIGSMYFVYRPRSLHVDCMRSHFSHTQSMFTYFCAECETHVICCLPWLPAAAVCMRVRCKKRFSRDSGVRLMRTASAAAAATSAATTTVVHQTHTASQRVCDSFYICHIVIFINLAGVH